MGRSFYEEHVIKGKVGPYIREGFVSPTNLEQLPNTGLIRSLYMSPIEQVWLAMKEYVNHEAKPTSKAELIMAIETFWIHKLTTDLCNGYINDLVSH
ncbi:hypothetical protein ANANG_G00315130 [Anguilla anguilla]|uniref:Uncharacterized protein n=1 Tax=Anguilla anguilla TaxID=7936 RepID=A0A9D3LHK6_ANGAN|nr:hypothetical protein ANANG_G00315130 [Anguilla anguilla]